MPDMKIDDFIDHNTLREAKEQHDAATLRLKIAQSGLAAAQGAHDRAKLASEAAIKGESTVSAMDAEHDLEAAAKALRVAEKVHDAARESHTDITEWQTTASGLAHRGVYLEGIRRRLEAARKGDKARAMLAEADADHLAATMVLQHAHQLGTPHFGNAHNGPRGLQTEAQEAAIWAGAGVDIAKGTTLWDPGAAPYRVLTKTEAAA